MRNIGDLRSELGDPNARELAVLLEDERDPFPVVVAEPHAALRLSAREARAVAAMLLDAAEKDDAWKARLLRRNSSRP